MIKTESMASGAAMELEECLQLLDEQIELLKRKAHPPVGDSHPNP